jgi:hypothetical protein
MNHTTDTVDLDASEAHQVALMVSALDPHESGPWPGVQLSAWDDQRRWTVPWATGSLTVRGSAPGTLDSVVWLPPRVVFRAAELALSTGWVNLQVLKAYPARRAVLNSLGAGAVFDLPERPMVPTASREGNPTATVVAAVGPLTAALRAALRRPGGVAIPTEPGRLLIGVLDGKLAVSTDWTDVGGGRCTNTLDADIVSDATGPVTACVDLIRLHAVLDELEGGEVELRFLTDGTLQVAQQPWNAHFLRVGAPTAPATLGDALRDLSPSTTDGGLAVTTTEGVQIDVDPGGPAGQGTLEATLMADLEPTAEVLAELNHLNATLGTTLYIDPDGSLVARQHFSKADPGAVAGLVREMGRRLEGIGPILATLGAAS